MSVRRSALPSSAEVWLRSVPCHLRTFTFGTTKLTSSPESKLSVSAPADLAIVDVDQSRVGRNMDMLARTGVDALAKQAGDLPCTALAITCVSDPVGSTITT